MLAALASGALWFGLVIGFITYRTMFHKKDAAISDIAAIIGAVGGAAVVALFPAQSTQFDYYAYGLAIGFFLYFIILQIMGGAAARTSTD
jgi:hypothetical protein